MRTKEMYSTHDIAKICGVALTTVASWIDKKKIRGFRTPGGHRRVKRTDVIEFLTKYNMPVPGELEQNKCLITLIEADSALAKASTEAIEEDGDYRVNLASSAFRAGTAINEGKVDMIIVDLDTPGLDIRELCRTIRSTHEIRSVPILALGNPSEQESQDLMAAGATDFLAKPFDGKRIAKKVRRHCPAPVRY